MSTNKDLSEQLQAMRLKAKEAASAEPPPPPAAQPSPVVEAAPSPKLKVLSNEKPKVTKQGRERGTEKRAALALATADLSRTTITLKSGDNEALSELQNFLIKRVRKAAPTSTLIRLALLYTRKALSSDAESLAQVYAQIREEDGRRKAVNV